MVDEAVPYLLCKPLASEGATLERAIAAYRIPYLPDVISMRELAEREEQEALDGLLDAQAQVIAALSGWQGQGFALRYLFHPERRAIELVALVRADAPPGEAGEIVLRMGRQWTRLLAELQFPCAPVLTEQELSALLAPPDHNYIAEIRQHEELTPLRMGDAYVMAPWRATRTSWLAIFDRMSQQQAPCLINIQLQPTRLRSDEREAFEQSASLARGLTTLRLNGYSGNNDLADPLAATVAALYDDYAQRLATAFLVVIQIASPSVDAIHALADAVTRDVTEQMDVRMAHASGATPRGADLVIPQSAEEALTAHHTLTQLALQPWGATHANPTQDRLRYLMDAHTARAAFRFPIPSRTGIPGMETRATALGRSKVFISYRRDDSAGTTGRIYDRLIQRFGRDSIYMDVAAIPLGVDFEAHIRHELAECVAQVVIIGPRWLDIRDSAGVRRLDSAVDYVRMEVELGLRSGIAVIPLFIDGAAMPPAELLPPTLSALPLRNGWPVRHSDFDHDIAIVVAAIEEQLRRSGGSPTR